MTRAARCSSSAKAASRFSSRTTPASASCSRRRGQASKERIRGDIEYEVNLKAELEIAHLHEKMDRLHQEAVGRLDELQRLVKTPEVRG
jgi:hypothetical protein